MALFLKAYFDHLHLGRHKFSADKVSRNWKFSMPPIGEDSKLNTRRSAQIHDTIDRIFAYADDKDIPTFLAANELAERRIRRLGKVKGTYLGPRERKYRGIC